MCFFRFTFSLWKQRLHSSKTACVCLCFFHVSAQVNPRLHKREKRQTNDRFDLPLKLMSNCQGKIVGSNRNERERVWVCGWKTGGEERKHTQCFLTTDYSAQTCFLNSDTTDALGIFHTPFFPSAAATRLLLLRPPLLQIFQWLYFLFETVEGGAPQLERRRPEVGRILVFTALAVYLEYT